jgi:hypothetical protein
MNCIRDIIVPLVCAIIGGGLTLVGVVWTIRHENKIRREEFERVKPVLISHAGIQNGENKLTNFMLYDDDYDDRGCINVIMKNTDKGLAYIDRVETHSENSHKVYMPKECIIIDKEICFELILNNIKNESLQRIDIHYRDIYDNEYSYEGILEPLSSQIFVAKLLGLKVIKKRKQIKQKEYYIKR